MWNLSEPELLRMEPLCGTARNLAEPGARFRAAAPSFIGRTPSLLGCWGKIEDQDSIPPQVPPKQKRKAKLTLTKSLHESKRLESALVVVEDTNVKTYSSSSWHKPLAEFLPKKLWLDLDHTDQRNKIFFLSSEPFEQPVKTIQPTKNVAKETYPVLFAPLKNSVPFKKDKPMLNPNSYAIITGKNQWGIQTDRDLQGTLT